MYFSNISKIRAVITIPVLAGLFIWHASWLPASAAMVLNYLIPAFTALIVINEIIYTIYLHRFFVKVNAEVIQKEDTVENKLPVKHYDLRFDFKGNTFVTQFSETMMSSNLSNITRCNILIHKKPPQIILVDGFKLKYMNLIFSLMLVYFVYYYFTNPSGI
jgi:hypothetical protein